MGEPRKLPDARFVAKAPEGCRTVVAPDGQIYAASQYTALRRWDGKNWITVEPQSPHPVPGNTAH